MNVLKLLADFAKRLAFVIQDTQKNKDDIKQLEQAVKELMEEIRQIKSDNRRDRENAVYERENLLLRLEVTLLRAGHKGLIVTETPRPLLENTDEQE